MRFLSLVEDFSIRLSTIVNVALRNLRHKFLQSHSTTSPFDIKQHPVINGQLLSPDIFTLIKLILVSDSSVNNLPIHGDM